MRSLIPLWIWAIALATSPFANAADVTGSVADIHANKHLGAASCASSTCHGSTTVYKDSNVMQNEFTVWQESDKHARSFATLKTAESQAIARKLGLGDPTQAKVCLDCHTNNVPTAMRGEKFQVEDGVSCEACHGGSEKWIATHTNKDISHADNLKAGLYPTELPVERAKMCLSCHMGTKDRMITHKIMGAGHPRLQFELDAFTWFNPHYEIDADYIQRKGEFNGARDWALGQGVAAKNLLEQLSDNKTGWSGIFPELVLFDCHACHKKMSGNTWAARPSTGLGPGVVRLNDANLVTYRHVLNVVDAPAAARLREQTRALHRATTVSRDSTVSAANALRGTIESSLSRVSAYPFESASLGKVLASLLRDAEAGDYRDFAGAEQAALAAQSVISGFEASGAISKEKADSLNVYVDRINNTVANGDNFQNTQFVASLRSLVNAAR
jgi:Cytochrome c554 and c-prime